ncbi:hypothetical protein AHAS_Ahas12G0126800 [Arachis hypogaea]
MSFIELCIEFEQSKANRNIKWRDYKGDNEDEFESNYEVVDPNEDDDEVDDIMEVDVAEVAKCTSKTTSIPRAIFHVHIGSGNYACTSVF